MILLPVPADAIRNVWPDIRARLDEMAAGEEWLAEDVYHECLVGNAYLFATAERDAFCVLKVLAASFGRDLFVWIARNDSPVPARGYFDQLLSIARDNDCGQVTFESARKGWIRALPGVRVRQSYAISV
jgi:hypothetical protein